MNHPSFRLFHKFVPACFFILSLVACNQERKQNADALQVEAGSATVELGAIQVADFNPVDSNFQEQVASVYKQYLALKDALVATNQGNAKTSAQTLLEKLGQVEVTALPVEQKTFFDNHSGPIKLAAQAIVQASTIQEQRTQLDGLSLSLFSLLKAFGAHEQTAYYQYCPMANDDKGAYWISQEAQIKNPYFGDEMLGCGQVKETLAKQ